AGRRRRPGGAMAQRAPPPDLSPDQKRRASPMLAWKNAGLNTTGGRRDVIWPTRSSSTAERGPLVRAAPHERVCFWNRKARPSATTAARLAIGTLIDRPALAPSRPCPRWLGRASAR